MNMDINDAKSLAEVTAAFEAYEAALMRDDIKAMDFLFHDAPTTIRYGASEVLYGADQIRAYRKTRDGSPQRVLTRVEITVYGGQCATTSAEFIREGASSRGRQTQTWIRFPDGWKVVSAHVSIESRAP